MIKHYLAVSEKKSSPIPREIGVVLEDIDKTKHEISIPEECLINNSLRVGLVEVGEEVCLVELPKESHRGNNRIVVPIEKVTYHGTSPRGFLRLYYMNNQNWEGEVCDFCGRRNVIGFEVSDLLWKKVIDNPTKIACLTCFDEIAEEKNITYSLEGIKLYHVSWSDWIIRKVFPIEV